MKTKKSTGTGFKQLLFYYLAVTKALYWIYTFSEMGSFAEFGNVFITRMLNQDIMVIMCLIAMHLLNKFIFSKASENDFWANVKLYTLGLVSVVAIITGYFLVLGLFFDAYIGNWFTFIMNMVIIYLIIAVIIHFKDKLKKKESEHYLPDADTDEAKIAMLSSLRDAGVLTQEEFEEKSATIGIYTGER